MATPLFPLGDFFARCEAKTRIRQHDRLKLAGEKIRCEQVESVPTFLSVCANKFAMWKIGLRHAFFRTQEQLVIYNEYYTVRL